MSAYYDCNIDLSGDSHKVELLTREMSKPWVAAGGITCDTVVEAATEEALDVTIVT